MLALRKAEKVRFAPPKTRLPDALRYGRMYEDHAVERSAFRPGGRVFCIASAGCTALALAARGDEVTAIDRNPAQIDYLRERALTGQIREGNLERLLTKARRTLPWLGLSPAKLKLFLSLSDPIDQVHYWRNQLDTAAWRATVDHALQHGLLRTFRAKRLADVVPGKFGFVLRHRLERCWALHPNRSNPYVWRLLLDDDCPEQPVKLLTGQLNLHVAEAADYLESCTPGTFQGFTLSNILDGCEEFERRRLLAAIRHAAAPQAVLVTRSFREPEPHTTNNLAERDRSALWGIVKVEPVIVLAR